MMCASIVEIINCISDLSSSAIDLEVAISYIAHPTVGCGIVEARVNEYFMPTMLL